MGVQTTKAKSKKSSAYTKWTDGRAEEMVRLKNDKYWHLTLAEFGKQFYPNVSYRALSWQKWRVEKSNPDMKTDKPVIRKRGDGRRGSMQSNSTSDWSFHTSASPVPERCNSEPVDNVQRLDCAELDDTTRRKSERLRVASSPSAHARAKFPRLEGPADSHAGEQDLDMAPDTLLNDEDNDNGLSGSSLGEEIVQQITKNQWATILERAQQYDLLSEEVSRLDTKVQETKALASSLEAEKEELAAKCDELHAASQLPQMQQQQGKRLLEEFKANYDKALDMIREEVGKKTLRELEGLQDILQENSHHYSEILRIMRLDNVEQEASPPTSIM